MKERGTKSERKGRDTKKVERVRKAKEAKK